MRRPPKPSSSDATPPRTRASTLRRGYWLVTATLAGAVAMSLEIAAARLLAPHLGSSIQVWGTLISVVLGAMAVGYVLGGALADRATSDQPLYLGLFAAALLEGLALFGAPGLLERVGRWSELTGTAAATLALFGLPVMLLAGVAPYVVRLELRADRPGRTAGLVYALGTAGSIAGVLLTSFVLLPDLGTRATLLTLASVTLGLGLLGTLWPRKLVALAALPLLLLADTEPPQPPYTIHQEESIYHLVRVVDLGPMRGLVLDQNDLQSLVDREGGPSNGYWDDFVAGPVLAEGPRVLSLGLGAGVSVRAALLADPEAEVDAVEIDAAIVRVATDYFDIEPGPDLRLHVADARRYLAASDARWDVIQADLFRDGPTIPFHLTTLEFFQLVRAHLEPGGVFMMNVFDLAPDHPLLGRVAATLEPVFPTLLVRTRMNANHVVFAFPGERSLEEVRAALRDPALRPEVAALTGPLATELRELVPPPDAVALTDDRAPLERLTRAMLESARAASEQAPAP